MFFPTFLHGAASAHRGKLAGESKKVLPVSVSSFHTSPLTVIGDYDALGSLRCVSKVGKVLIEITQ